MLETLAAFASGIASVLTAGYAIRKIIARCDEDCEKRMAAFREGLDRRE